MQRNLDTGFSETLKQEKFHKALKEKLINLEALVTDFDGVHTNNSVLIGSDGEEQVQVNRSDGLGYELISRELPHLLIISGENSELVKARAEKLGCDSIVGAKTKLEELTVWSKNNQVNLNLTLYVGNDVNDISAMEACGVRVAVADALPNVISISHFVTTKPGGFGAVREVIDFIISERNQNPQTQR